MKPSLGNRNLLILLAAMAFAGADSVYYPASPLQPAGRPQAPAAPQTPLTPLPYVAPTSGPQPIPTPTDAPAKLAPLPLGCSEACSTGRIEKIVFDYRGGRIGAESRVIVSDSDDLEIRAYSEECPKQAGKATEVRPEEVPDGCIFLFEIPASRASVTSGSKHVRQSALRCSAGRIGMSGFSCNESNSPPGSFGSPELSRDSGE